MQSIRELKYSLLPENKYTNYYIQLIESRLHNKPIKYYTEKHHIFPICVFGNNNLRINLTHREHYIAHVLLYKSYLVRYNPNQVFVKRLKKTVDVYRSYDKYNRNLTSKEFHNIRLMYYKSK